MTQRSHDFSVLATAVDYLIDDQVGILQFVREMPKDAGDPDFFHYYSQTCHTKAFWKQTNFARAGGASSHREVALAKAVGEAIERYCSACYDSDELSLTSYKNASFECIPPEEFALYSDKQYTSRGFPYIRFDANTNVRWTHSIDLVTNTTVYVPAAMVYLPYSYSPEGGEGQIVQPISTGLACHSSYEQAIISAVCEVIERDSFTITWQARVPVAQIRWDSLSESNRDLAARFNRTGNQVCLFNITTDIGVPTILAVSRSEHPESPALVVAASTDLDPQRAACKSLEELAHTWQLAKSLKHRFPPFVPSSDYGNMFHQDDHILFYCEQRNARLADFLWASDRSVDCDDIGRFSTDSPRQDLSRLIETIRYAHHRVLLVDVTTPDVGSLGLSVVRAIIPGLHPLFMGHRFRALGGKRIWTVPQILGYAGLTELIEDNPAPHPYP